MTKKDYWAKPKKKALERDLQADVIDLAHSLGWYCEKIVAPGRNGIPDLLCIRHGCVLLIELKKKGEEARVQQELHHNDLRAHGANVLVIDRIEHAKEVLR